MEHTTDVLWRFMSRLKPELALESDGEPVPNVNLKRVQTHAEAVPAAGSITEWVYEDEALAIQLKLRFELAENGLAVVHVAYASTSEMVGGRCLALHPRRGISLIANQSEAGVEAAAWPYKALHLHKDWWTRPAFGTAWSALPPRTQSLLFKLEDGTGFAVLPLVGSQLKTELVGVSEGFAIRTSAYAGGFANVETAAFVLSVDASPYEAIRKAMKAGLQAVGSPGGMREERRYPEMFEYLGWCSWDAFYYEVSDRGMSDKAAELKELGVPVRWMIVDAGWSDDDDYALKSFRAHPEKFPQGLGAAVKKLKADYGMKWVGVWHTLIGYWNGIAHDSELAQQFGDALAPTRCGKLVPKPSADKAFPFWNAWHRQSTLR